MIYSRLLPPLLTAPRRGNLGRRGNPQEAFPRWRARPLISAQSRLRKRDTHEDRVGEVAQVCEGYGQRPGITAELANHLLRAKVQRSRG